MSEYQNYEWKAVDRALSSSQLRKVSGLSSHITVQGGYAQVDYQWGDFKHDPVKVLLNYFDVFVYEANWGQQRVAMRFPVDALDVDELVAFEVDDALTVSISGGNLVIEVEYIENWVEPRGYYRDYGDENLESEVIQGLDVIYQEMLEGDFRGLFLLWLKACEQSGEESDFCAWVPPGLGSLDWQHQRLIEFVEVDGYVLKAAQKRSGKSVGRRPAAPDLGALLGKLATVKKDNYLRRLIDGDTSHVRAELRQELKKLAGVKPAAVSKGGMVEYSQLAGEAVEALELEKKRLAMEKERKRGEYLAELGRREDEIWDRVGELVAEKKTNSYEEAVKLLCALKDLWTSREDVETCYKGVRTIVESFPRLVGFRSRVEDAGLLGDAKNGRVSKNVVFLKKEGDDPLLRMIDFDQQLKGL